VGFSIALGGSQFLGYRSGGAVQPVEPDAQADLQYVERFSPVQELAESRDIDLLFSKRAQARVQLQTQ
jgi:hypothetical protein